MGVLVSGLVQLALTGQGLVVGFLPCRSCNFRPGAVQSPSLVQVAWHLAGLVAVTAWTFLSSLLVMLPLLLCGKLRVRDRDEATGLDIKKILEQGYSSDDVESTCNEAGLNTYRANPLPCALVSPSQREELATTRRMDTLHLTSLMEQARVVTPRVDRSCLTPRYGCC